MKKIIILISLFSNICFAQMTSPVQKFIKVKASNDTNKDVAQSDAMPLVTFYGLTSLNSSNDNLASNLTATGRLAVEISLLPELKLNIGANLLNANPTKGIKKDSVDFNSLMFPETGNFGFLFSPSLKLLEKNKHSLFLEGTYAYRKIAIDSPNISFKINSVNIGLKYSWVYNSGNKDSDNLIFSFMAYWNLFNIPDEDVKKFDILINDPLFLQNDKNAEIYSIGLKTTVQYKSFLFFADLRRNTGTKNLDDNNPLKGTKFNIGFATSIQLKSF